MMTEAQVLALVATAIAFEREQILEALRKVLSDDAREQLEQLRLHRDELRLQREQVHSLRQEVAKLTSVVDQLRVELNEAKALGADLAERRVTN